MECKVGMIMEKAISLMGRSESIFGMSSNMMRQLPPKPLRQEAFKDLVMNFILDQEKRVKQLKKYIGVIKSDFMQLSLKVVEKLKDEIRAKENRVKKIEKITRCPENKDLKPSKNLKFSKTLAKSTSFHALNSSRQNHSVSNTSAQSSLVHLLASTAPFPSFTSLEVDLGEERCPEPPIKPPSPDSFRIKEVDRLTNHTPPSPHVVSFHPKDTCCYYHPCIDDLKKHYEFKPGLLGYSGSLGVDFLNMEMIEDDWELEYKEPSFQERELNSPVRPKEVEKVIFDKNKLGSS
uniref:Uncharacterized protein n=1 Tax=Tanacetum cinerariifolium TaxID=118510 RepID=A0A6L2JUK7_TANCI|nr:hypothetical protein [Tanacetum cinerariifolium]